MSRSAMARIRSDRGVLALTDVASEDSIDMPQEVRLHPQDTHCTRS